MKEKNKKINEKSKKQKIKKFLFVLFIFLLIYLIGVLFYVYVEDFSLVDAIYFVAVTISTVGYGDIIPKTNIGRLFTAIYSLVSLFILFYLINSLLKLLK